MAAALFADDIADALRLERQLARELQTLRDLVVEAGRQVAAADNPRQALRLAGRRRLVPRSVRRRVARLIGELVRQGVADAEREMDRSRRRKSRFAVQPIPGGLELPKVDEAEVELYHRVASLMVDQLEAEQFGLVREAVEAGLRAGETDEAIGARIDQLDTGLARAHADTWARTESTRYYTLGRSAAIEAADDVWGYEYVVIVDNRTTAICRAFVGKRVSKVAMRKFPPFHYNCRTTVAAVFFDEAPEVEDELGDDAVAAEGFGADPREVMTELGAPRLPDWMARKVPDVLLDRVVGIPAALLETEAPYQAPTYSAPEPLLPAAAQRIRYAEVSIADEPVEWSIAFDRAGNERGERQRGWRRGVDLPKSNLAGMVATHNHPDANSFSHQDLYQSMRRGLYEFRAGDGPDTPIPGTPRYRYRVQPGPDGWPLMSLEQYATVYAAARAQVDHWILTVDDDDLALSLFANRSHQVMELLAERLRLRYSRKLL